MHIKKMRYNTYNMKYLLCSLFVFGMSRNKYYSHFYFRTTQHQHKQTKENIQSESKRKNICCVCVCVFKCTNFGNSLCSRPFFFTLFLCITKTRIKKIKTKRTNTYWRRKRGKEQMWTAAKTGCLSFNKYVHTYKCKKRIEGNAVRLCLFRYIYIYDTYVRSIHTYIWCSIVNFCNIIMHFIIRSIVEYARVALRVFIENRFDPPTTLHNNK